MSDEDKTRANDQSDKASDNKMSDEDKTRANDQSDKASDNTPATSEYVDEPIDNKPKTDPKETNGCQTDKEPIKGIGNIDQKDGWTIANKISAFGIVISIIVAIFTYLLFQKTIEANKTSHDALTQSTRANDIAEQALRDSRINDSLTNERQKAIDAFENNRDLRNRIKDSITIGLAQQSLETQKFYTERSDSNFIKSIRVATSALDVSKESIERIQNNFERENRAIMFISQFKADILKLGSRTTFNIEFKNFGKSPTILTDVAIAITLDTSYIVKDEKFKYTLNDITYVNLFLPVNGAFNKNINLTPIPELAYNEIVSGRLKVFVFGEATYFDIIRKQYSAYQFCFRVNPNGKFAPTPNHNMIREVYEVPIDENKKTTFRWF